MRKAAKAKPTNDKASLFCKKILEIFLERYKAKKTNLKDFKFKLIDLANEFKITTKEIETKAPQITLIAVRIRLKATVMYIAFAESVIVCERDNLAKFALSDTFVKHLIWIMENKKPQTVTGILANTILTNHKQGFFNDIT